ncbi:MAG: thiamine phosphate synthase [Pseudomonadota bacterium]
MVDPCRLYLITPPILPDVDAFADALKAAFAGGPIAAVQLRLKAPDGGAPAADDVKRAAERLAPIIRDGEALFIINDYPALAEATGADGVHIGQSDASYEAARARLGDDAVVGVTCHASSDLAMAAGAAGADYVAFGAFFPTTTKDAPTRAPVSLIEDWTFATNVPCVAIGGITVENAAPLVMAGADYLAVSAGIWAAADGPERAVSRFQRLFSAAG